MLVCSEGRALKERAVGAAVSAVALHAMGRGFDSLTAHHLRALSNGRFGRWSGLRDAAGLVGLEYCLP